MQTTLATRYARALAEVVREPAPLEKTAGELETVSGVVGESKPLREFLLNPAFPLSGKAAVLDSLIKAGKISTPTARLLHLLLKKGRLDLLADVSGEFRRIEEEILGRVSVEVTTAVPLEPDLRKKIIASLQEFTGKTVRLQQKVDPAILGGARARIGSVLYDGTVAGRMERLRQRLIGER